MHELKYWLWTSSEDAVTIKNGQMNKEDNTVACFHDREFKPRILQTKYYKAITYK